MATKIKMKDIDNAKLEEVMRIYMEEPDQNKLMQLVMALKDTKVFVPAMVNNKVGGFQPYIIKNQAGDMYMPAFTSMKKFPENEKYEGMLKMQYKQCAAMLLDHPTLVQGIALNPFIDNLMLKTQMLELTRQVDEQVKNNPPKVYQVKTGDFRMMMRHNVEFHEIPEKLFKEKMAFIQSLSEEEFCRLYQHPYEQAGQGKMFTYTKKDFEIMELDIRDDLNFMQVVLPTEFLFKTNCRELYILWNPETERIGYYLIEKGENSGEGEFFLDEVREDGSWERLEEAPSEGNVMYRVMELFDGQQDDPGNG